MNDIIRTLQFEKEQLEARIRLLEDKLESDNRQISAYDAELREAKRLLKAAVENIEDGDCEYCAYNNDAECPAADIGCGFKWIHADEALALIGKDIDVPATEGDTNVGRERRIENE